MFLLVLKVAYIIGGLVGIAGGVPQMIKLIKTKSSEDFELKTWAIWSITQTISVLYLSTLRDWLPIFVNAIWLIFYLAMIYLIVKFQAPQKASVKVT